MASLCASWRTVRSGTAGAHKGLIQFRSNSFNRQVIRKVQPKAHRRPLISENILFKASREQPITVMFATWRVGISRL